MADSYTIINNSPNISGTWSAVLSGTQTFYVSSGAMISGPVNIVGGSLAVLSGAVVSGLVAADNGSDITITVSSGGTIAHSTVFDGFLTVSTGGISQHNLYYSEVTNIYGSSMNDTFEEPGNVKGTLNGTPFTVGNNVGSVYVANGGSLLGSTTSNTTVNTANGCYIGPGESVAPFTIVNDAPTLSGGLWSATRDQTGNTVYVSGTTIVSGPVNLTSGATLTITSGAVVSGLTAADNATGIHINVLSGGIIEHSSVYDGYLVVSAGGYSHDNFYYSEYADFYGSSTNDFFQEPGSVNGTLNGAPIKIGNGAATLNVKSGGSVSGDTVAGINPVVDAGGYLEKPKSLYAFSNSASTISGGMWTASAGANGVTRYMSGTTVVSGPVNLTGGATLTVTSGAIVSGLTAADNATGIHINVLSGGVIENSNVYDGYLVVSAGGISQDNRYFSEYADIWGSSINDSFSEPGDVAGTLNGSAIKVGNGAQQVIVYDGGVITNPTYDGRGSFMINQGGVIDVCFLTGTLIETPEGRVAVENLRIGQDVIVQIDGVNEVRPLSWAGTAHCIVRTDLPDDEAGYPVRIKKDALGAHHPFEDLLVTAEHCLFLDGRFIPARMLVNGRSIHYDRSITAYTYHHIETETHSVIIANGALTESYLDTGNRRRLQSHDGITMLASRHLTWGEDSAAPLSVEREIVEPIHERLRALCDTHGLPLASFTPHTTSDSNLHLIADNGSIIRPLRNQNKQVIFMLPAGTRAIRICSFASRPCDVIGPFVDDRRRLGVLVGDIAIFESKSGKPVLTHLTEERLEGWHARPDGEIARWTNGNGWLPLGERPANSMALIAIEIRAAGPYLIDEIEAPPMRRQA
ncbi:MULTISPECIES: Hint domain-containing protein [unclassified Asaia]|uniref:Hint domain-containing protein n=1 Tax=unclassified Asaia TaxID=2685023 RepID=UPI000F8D5680|nr:Hint domain-containing protein [Asaia sp. W19]